MKNNNPIGIFDSGVGGLSIWKEINTLLPNEHTIYLADSANAPYGQKSEQDIIDLSIKNTELLLLKGCKIIVVACNTATTNAIQLLRRNYDVPFIGIEPAIKPAALHTKTKAIGILATKGTLSSELFQSTSELHAENIEIVEQVGKGLVELIEAGKMNSSAMKKLLQSYIDPMIAKNIDYLVLGCTHYPFLIPLLRELLPVGVNIIDSGEAVARQTKSVLSSIKMLSELKKEDEISNKFYINTDPKTMSDLVGKKFKVDFLDF